MQKDSVRTRREDQFFHLLSGKPDPPNKNKWGPSNFVLLSGQSSEEEEEEDDEYDVDEEEEEELVQTP